MKYVDEFRDPRLARSMADDIQSLVARLQDQGRERPLKLMEVCGGHTHTIFRYGLEALLGEDIEFVHGPGCPVCGG